MAGMEEQPGVREIHSVEGLRALADPVRLAILAALDTRSGRCAAGHVREGTGHVREGTSPAPRRTPDQAWLDADGLARRIAVMTDPVAGDGGTPMWSIVELWDFGVLADITPPAPGEVLSPRDAYREAGGLGLHPRRRRRPRRREPRSVRRKELQYPERVLALRSETRLPTGQRATDSRAQALALSCAVKAFQV
jgi:DNA-binding transcriptional ArsR family regulator